jgi:hypothetical protein
MPTINCIYDPSTGILGSIPDSFTVSNGEKEIVTVNLSLVAGALGTIVFADPPLTWGDNGSPPGATIVPPAGGTSQAIVTETNSNSSPSDVSYGFLINFVYTSPTGEIVSGSGDPTIINDGTGA